MTDERMSCGACDGDEYYVVRHDGTQYGVYCLNCRNACMLLTYGDEQCGIDNRWLIDTDE